MIGLYIVTIIIGYLLGSISPAYILGKLRKGIDIRKYGSKNAGTMNAFHVLGKSAGITTLVFDSVKGILAILIAYLLLIGTKFSPASLTGTPFLVMCLAGLAAILGHDFPFYMQFRGGKGAATAGGIMALLIIILLFQPYWSGTIPVIIITCFGLAIFFITGSVNLTAFICYPAFIVALLITTPGPITTAFCLFTAYSLITSIINMVQKGKLDVRLAKPKEGELKLWRKILKFASLVFPILYFWLNKKYILIIIGAFLMIFLVLEFVRVKKKILGLYKKSESKISGFIWYLLGALITTALFPKEIAILALIFAAVGDNFAILLGIPFGRTKLFRQKTVQGTIACLASSFLAGLMAMPFLNVSLLIIIVGSAAATLAELFSGFYDNLTMAPVSALVMSL